MESKVRKQKDAERDSKREKEYSGSVPKSVESQLKLARIAITQTQTVLQ